MTTRNTPTLAEVIRGAIRAQLADVNTAIPARITEYDHAAQRCSAQPLVQRAYVDESGVRQVETLPIVTDVPVVFPGSGGYGITWPVGVGTTGLLKFTSASIDLWLAKGGLVDPRDDRRHSMSDGVFEPGLRPFNAPIGDVADAAMVLRTEGEIHAGGTQALAYASELEELRGVIAAALSGDAIPGAVAALGPYDGTTVLKGG